MLAGVTSKCRVMDDMPSTDNAVPVVRTTSVAPGAPPAASISNPMFPKVSFTPWATVRVAFTVPRTGRPSASTRVAVGARVTA